MPSRLSTKDERNKGLEVAYRPKAFQVRKIIVISADLLQHIKISSTWGDSQYIVCR